MRWLSYHEINCLKPMDLNAYDVVVRTIYEAPQAPAAWVSVFKTLRAWLHMDAWVLLRYHVSASNMPPDIVSLGGERISAQAPVRYTEYYAGLDTRATLTRSAPTGEVVNCQQHFDEHYVARSEFYQDFLIPEGLRYAIGSCVLRSATSEYVIGMQRGGDHPGFSRNEEALVRRLVPHLGRAFQLSEELEGHRRRAAIQSAALDTSGNGLIAVDIHGNILFADRHGERLLRQGKHLQSRRGMLVLSAPIFQQRFMRLLARCACTGEPGSLQLPDAGNGTPRYSLTLFMPKPVDDLGSGGSLRSLMCLFTPLTNRRLVTMKQLIELFGLTPAEARVAKALATGTTLEDYAAAENLKLPTVKTQLREVFAKTNTRRQAALVGLLNSIPAIRS